MGTLIVVAVVGSLVGFVCRRNHKDVAAGIAAGTPVVVAILGYLIEPVRDVIMCQGQYYEGDPRSIPTFPTPDREQLHQDCLEESAQWFERLLVRGIVFGFAVGCGWAVGGISAGSDEKSSQ